jgi:transposase
VGRPATLEVPKPHIRVNLISAISNEGAVRFMTYTGTMDGARFVVFLERLLRTSTRKVFLVVDRLKAHEKATVMDWIEAHKDRIELFFMPPYTPEYNPDEYLNNDLKGNVHEAGLPGNKEELRSQVQRFMRRLFAAPEHVMSYFQHPCVQYAAGT